MNLKYLVQKYRIFNVLIGNYQEQVKASLTMICFVK